MSDCFGCVATPRAVFPERGHTDGDLPERGHTEAIRGPERGYHRGRSSRAWSHRRAIFPSAAHRVATSLPRASGHTEGDLPERVLGVL
jgi:hypothetical protein